MVPETQILIGEKRHENKNQEMVDNIKISSFNKNCWDLLIGDSNPDCLVKLQTKVFIPHLSSHIYELHVFTIRATNHPIMK